MQVSWQMGTSLEALIAFGFLNQARVIVLNSVGTLLKRAWTDCSRVFREMGLIEKESLLGKQEFKSVHSFLTKGRWFLFTASCPVGCLPALLRLEDLFF